MPASFCAHSAKNGSSTPSARPATKNRNKPTRAGLGDSLSSARVEEAMFATATSELHATVRLPIGQAIGVRTGALVDVNAYGGRSGARLRSLIERASGRKRVGRPPD